MFENFFHRSKSPVEGVAERQERLEALVDDPGATKQPDEELPETVNPERQLLEAIEGFNSFFEFDASGVIVLKKVFYLSPEEQESVCGRLSKGDIDYDNLKEILGLSNGYSPVDIDSVTNLLINKDVFKKLDENIGDGAANSLDESLQRLAEATYNQLLQVVEKMAQAGVDGFQKPSLEALNYLFDNCRRAKDGGQFDDGWYQNAARLAMDCIKGIDFASIDGETRELLIRATIYPREIFSDRTKPEIKLDQNLVEGLQSFYKQLLQHADQFGPNAEIDSPDILWSKGVLDFNTILDIHRRFCTFFSSKVREGYQADPLRAFVFEISTMDIPEQMSQNDRNQFIEAINGNCHFEISGDDLDTLFDLIRFYKKRRIKDAKGLTDWSKCKELDVHDLTYALIIAKSEHGALPTLTNKYGIKNYARYPIDLLLDQARDDADVDVSPYGIAILPYSDHNGAFHNTEFPILGVTKIIGSTYEQLQGTGYKIKVAEAGSKIDLVRRLTALTKRNGDRHKISFLILGGHGADNSIQFGENEDSGRLYTSDLLGRGVQRAVGSKFLEDGATIILDSCSTGARNGIARGLSLITKGEVIAPEESTSGAISSVKIIDGKPEFSVRYLMSDKAAFIKGEKVS